jgi:CubicO group peptidase (beta-lactamase class C family)
MDAGILEAPVLDGRRPLRQRMLLRMQTVWKWRTLLWVLAAWTLVGFFRAADRYFSDPFQRQRLEFGLWEALAQSLLASYIWAAMTPAVVVLAKHSLPTRANWAAPLSRLLAVGLALPVIHCAAYQLLYPLLMGFPCIVPVQLGAVRRLLPVAFPTHFVTYCAIVGATWTILYSRLSRERELRTSQMKTRVATARLEALKMQLHPHFLFNTLNSILPLVFRDRDAAARTVVRLGDLLRLSLQNEASDLIPLRKELEVLQVYLEIQETRFQDRLTVRLDVEREAEEALVPNLILQPLVENAIKHGIAARPGAGRVEVLARRDGARLLLRVRDDGPGPSEAPPRTSPRREGGVGLRNTRDRLELLYANDHDFTFEGAPGRGCEVTLSFPLAYPKPASSSAAAANGGAGVAALRRAAVLSVALALGLFASPSAADARPRAAYAQAIAKSRAMLDEVLQLYPGTAVAVAVGDDIVWSTAFGFADVDRQRPVSRSTQFRIYEAAMPLTATVMARLAEEGRIDLDAPIQRYLPDAGESALPVTLRALAAHLGGVRDLAEDEEVPGTCSGARDALRALGGGNPFVRPAGLALSVSRYGYMMLSAALEAATGERFADLLNETIAGPTGMTSTLIDDPRRYLPGRTQFYERGFLGLLRSARTVDTSCRSGAGGLVSTTEDLVRFASALLRGEIVRRETLETMFTPQKTRAGQRTGYGLGWYVETDARGRRYVWHDGRGVGGRAAIVVVPHARLVTVMLSNIEGERLDEHARRIAAFFLEAEDASTRDILRAQSPANAAPPFAYSTPPAPGE